jgi:vault protein inter-alpha-trypsin-like protein
MAFRAFHATVILFACASCAPAFAANPSIEAYERGIEDPLNHRKALSIAELRLDLDVVGSLVDGTLTAKFFNPTGDMLEGRFAFEMPAGAVVTGYALDIEGTLVDGVLVEPLKARRSYEERVRQRVDPGLAEVSRANQFTTQIYPFLARSARTIRVKFSAPMDSKRGLVIPLATTQAVGKFTFNARAGLRGKPPQIEIANLPGPLEWRESPDGLTASITAEKHRFAGALQISPGKSPDAILSQHPNGRRFFQIVDTGHGIARDLTGAKLRIYWDRSLSRRDDRLSDERALVGQLVARMRPASIDLVSFNSSGAKVRRVAADALDGALRNMLYRGATSFRVLEGATVPAADICLVFSDGVVNLDARPDFRPGCEVFAITSAPDADAGFLARLTRQQGGEVIRIGTMSTDELMTRLTRRPLHVIDARSDNGSPLDFALLDTANGGFTVVGEAREARTVVLRIANLGRDVIERRYSLTDARPAKFAGAGVLWAASRTAALAAEDGGRTALVALSRQFSIAGPSLSFLVLERPDDYLEADIAPPANYPKALVAEYREMKKEHDEEKREALAGRLDEVIGQWNEQKEWWNTSFDGKPRQISPEKSEAVAPVLARAAAPVAPAGEMTDSLDEIVVVTGMRGVMNASMDMRMGVVDATSISVALEEWGPDRPYLKALDAARPEEIDRTLAREEGKYGALPAFYFDVAEWLYRRKRTTDALEMLLSALDLPVANEETVAMVADRLLRFGRADRAVWLYERALDQTDYLPQPRRTLALALAKRAESAAPESARRDLVRAMRLLNEIITRPWGGDYDGIELVSLMEANRLLPRLQALRAKDIPLDPRLRSLLDVDVRVTIEWNTGATDMDLWVDEPSGERAIYNHPRTAIGGRLSNDMTSGYGPEEYLLKRAIPGEYRISVNVFAADSINPNGTTVVTAHLIRNFGRPTQSEETMELELEPDSSGEQRIGTFRVN